MTRLSLILSLLLLANNSLALEMLGHADMQHGAPHEMSDMTVALGEHMHSHQMSDEAPMNSADDDCFCDEICCPSSVNLLNSTPDSPLPHSEGGSIPNPLLYQSIALDLTSPPPNR